MVEDRSDQYRRQAEECRLKAAKTVHDDHKAGWLRLAEDWQRLAEAVDRGRREKQ